MPNVTNELILEHLKAMRSDMGDMKDEMRLMKDEMIAMKKMVGSLVMQDLNRDDEMAHVRKRLDRIEARLELVE